MKWLEIFVLITFTVRIMDAWSSTSPQIPIVAPDTHWDHATPTVCSALFHSSCHCRLCMMHSKCTETIVMWCELCWTFVAVRLLPQLPYSVHCEHLYIIYNGTLCISVLRYHQFLGHIQSLSIHSNDQYDTKYIDENWTFTQFQNYNSFPPLYCSSVMQCG